MTYITHHDYLSVCLETRYTHKISMLSSGNLLHSHWSHGPVEIVNLPSYKMMLFHSYVSLSEGNKERLFLKHQNFGGHLSLLLTNPPTGHPGTRNSMCGKHMFKPVFCVHDLYIYIIYTNITNYTIICSIVFCVQPSLGYPSLTHSQRRSGRSATGKQMRRLENRCVERICRTPCTSVEKSVWQLKILNINGHIRPYFVGIFPYIGLKNRPYIW